MTMYTMVASKTRILKTDFLVHAVEPGNLMIIFFGLMANGVDPDQLASSEAN